MSNRPTAQKKQSADIDLTPKWRNPANQTALAWLPENGEWQDLVYQPIAVGVGLSQLEVSGFAEKRRKGYSWEFRATELGLAAQKTMLMSV